MTDFRRVTDEFSVAPQISVADVAEAAAPGLHDHHQQPPRRRGARPARQRRDRGGRRGGGPGLLPHPGARRPDAGAGRDHAPADARGRRGRCWPSAAPAPARSSPGRSARRRPADRSRGELVGLGRAAGYDLLRRAGVGAMIPYVREIEFEYGRVRPGLAADPPGDRQQSRGPSPSPAPAPTSSAGARWR